MQRLHPPLPKPIPFTKAGFAKIQQEFEQLQTERPQAVAELQKAREMGDLSENGYYKAAKWKLSSIDSRLKHLAFLQKYAVIAEASSPDAVALGSVVTITNDNQTEIYTIVGNHEANPKEGKISSGSPLGKALMGKRKDEQVEVQTPQKKQQYRIVQIA